MLWHSSLFPQHALLYCLCLTEKVAGGGGAPSLRMVASQGGFGPRKWLLLANVKAVLMCLITFTNPSSGLSGCHCCMISVEHGLESLKAGLGLYIWNVSELFYMLWALSVCKATASATWPAATESGRLSLRGSALGAAPMETSLLSHQLLSCSLFLISQEPPRGCCLDCQRSNSLSFHTVFSSHMLSLPSLLILVSKSFVFSLFFSLLIFSSRGWVACTPGQLIQFPPLLLWDSCYSSVTEICLLSVPHQGPLFWLCSQHNYELLTVHLLCSYPWDQR